MIALEHFVALWWLLVLLPLLLMYLLRQRRDRLVVSTTLLWQRVLADHRVNTPLQRFRRNLLLLLQVILLILLVLALARPVWQGEAGSGAVLPIIIDCSASMGARDANGRSRLELALSELRSEIRAKPNGQRICVIAAGSRARKLCDISDNPRELLESLAELKPDAGEGELAPALELAEAMARTLPDGFDRVRVISDGNFPASTAFDLPFALDYQLLPPAGPNTGITELRAHEEDDGWLIFARIQSTPGNQVPASLQIALDGELRSSQEILLDEDGEARIRAKLNGAGGVLELRLQTLSTDSLSADDRVTVSLPPARPLRVATTLPDWRHGLAALGNVSAPPPETPPDLLIDSANSATPARVRLLIGIPNELAGVIQMAPEADAIIDWDRTAPLLQYAELDRLPLSRSPRLRTPQTLSRAGFDVIAEASRGPFLLRRLTAERIDYHLLLPLAESELSRRVAFPVLLANLAMLARRQAGGGAVIARSGGGNLLSSQATTLRREKAPRFNDTQIAAAAGSPRVARSLWWWLALSGFVLLVIEWRVYLRRLKPASVITL
ncbi:MAG: Ca-activated chloride channel family protein [Rhodothermales bacterium]